jgi:hypothetical protein
MNAAVQFGFRFGVAAGAVVAAGTLISELLPASPDDPFAPPPFGILTAVLSFGALAWSYMVASGTAWHLNGIERVPRSQTYGAGIVFALLTPGLGYFLSNTDFLVMTVSLLVWVLAFPAAATLVLWRMARPNNPLERSRE